MPINIDELTIGQLKELRDMLGAGSPIGNSTSEHCGLCIVAADRGFVSIGDLTIGERYVLTNARTIRRWGTIKGLGELVCNGPQPNTVLDQATPVREYERRAVLFFEPVKDPAKWNV